MPPQARKTSPVSRCLSSGGAGEWSEPIVSIRPCAEALPEPFAILALPDRRCALEARVAVGDLLGGEGQVMRAGLDSQRQALARVPVRSSEAHRPTTGERYEHGSETRGKDRS